MTRILLALAGAAALLAVPVRAFSAEAAGAASQAAGPASYVMAMCPMSVPGTEVVAADVPGGETLTFTTTAGPVAELRARVHDLAAIHDAHHGEPAGQGVTSRGMAGTGNAMSGAAMPPSRCTVLDLEDGATIVVVPVAPSDLEALRIAIRVRAQRLQEHGCEMAGQTLRIDPPGRP